SAAAGTAGTQHAPRRQRRRRKRLPGSRQADAAGPHGQPGRGHIHADPAHPAAAYRSGSAAHAAARSAAGGHPRPNAGRRPGGDGRARRHRPPHAGRPRQIPAARGAARRGCRSAAIAFRGVQPRYISSLMDLLVYAPGWALWDGTRLRCAVGRGGIRADKREGDGATPAGSWPMRRLLYRPDRIAAPPARLAANPVAPQDGWCDDPDDAVYNRPVRLPYRARAERLWREDGIYDLIVPLGYNDAPVVPGAGSAIFLHVARPDYAP